jgi:hypothetical protein
VYSKIFRMKTAYYYFVTIAVICISTIETWRQRGPHGHL